MRLPPSAAVATKSRVIIDRRRFDTHALICAVALIALAGIVVASRARGIWLDEFWSQRMGDAETPFGLLVTDRWLSDTHPPLANLLYRAVIATGATSIQGQRMMMNIPALVFLIAATAVFSRTSRVFPVVMFGVALSLPGSMEAFADFRSYGWQIAAITVTYQYAARMFSGEPLTKAEQMFGGCGVCLALSLHYVTGIILSFFVVGLIFLLWRARRVRQAFWVAAFAAIAWGSLTISGLILLGRMRRDIDFGWILTSTPTAFLLFGFVFVTTLLSAPLVTIFAIRGARSTLEELPQRRLAVLLLGTLAAGFGALVLLNFVNPIIVQRYLIGWQLTLAALVTLMAGPVLASGHWRLVAAMTFAGFMMVAGTFQAAGNTGWHENRDRIAALVRRCPTAQVYALSPWRLKTARTSNAARRETIVISEGYRRLARQGGFDVSVLDLTSPARVHIDNRCPTLIWIEHLDVGYIPDPDYIMRVGRLSPSRTADTRLISTASGILAIVRARTAAQEPHAMAK